MAHHHLLPLILSLILVILPSSSHAANQNQALFSDDGDFLVSGHNLTDGVNTLSLKEDCGLYYYYKSNSSTHVKNFNTPTDATGCVLKITNSGQLQVTYAASGKVIILGKAGSSGTYSLLFTNSGLAVYGPRIWDNKIQVPTFKKKNLRETTSSNVIYSPDRENGNAIDDTLLATNKDVSVYITPYCELSVNNTKTGKNIWNSNSASAKTGDCFLYLTSEGVLLLIEHDQKSNELITQWTGGAFAGVNDYVLLVRTSGSLEISGLMEDIREIPAYSASVAEKIKMVTAA